MSNFKPARVNPWLEQQLAKLHSPSTLEFIVETQPNQAGQVAADLARLTNLSVSTPGISWGKFVPITAPKELIPEILQVPGVVEIHYNAPKTIGRLGPPRIIDSLIGEVRLSKVEVPGSPFDRLLTLGPLSLFFQPSSGYEFTPTSKIRELIAAPEDNTITTKVAVLDTGVPFPVHPMATRPVTAQSVIAEPPWDALGHGTWCHTAAFLGKFTTRFGECRSVADALDSLHVKCLNSMGFGCLTGRDWILTTKGYRPAYAIKDGDYLINYNLESGVFECDRVAKTFKRKMQESEKLVRIKTNRDHIVLLTEDHMVLTQGGVWKKAKDLRELDEVFSYEPTKELHKRPQTYQMILKRVIKNPKGWPKNRLVKKCEMCGNEFEVAKSLSWIKYCSKLCRAKARRMKIPFKPPNKERLLAMQASKNRFSKKARRKMRLTRLRQVEFNKQQGDRLKKWRMNHSLEAYIGSLKGAVAFAKKKRKTKGEGLLQWALKKLGLEFETEYAIWNENELVTIVDVAFPEHKIAIFVDGIFWHGRADQINRDTRINQKLETMGWTVLRFLDTTIKTSAMQIAENITQIFVTPTAEDPIIIDTKNVDYQKPKSVYDFQTERNGTIVVNGIVVHNSTDDVLKAMEVAYKWGAKVISLSLGGPLQGSALHDDIECKVINDAKDAIWVVAAGNEGDPWSIESPGASPQALTVGAYSPKYGGVSVFSSRGPSGQFYSEHPDVWAQDLAEAGEDLLKPDVLAPGGGPCENGQTPIDLIYSGCQGWTDGDYDQSIDGFSPMRGSSMATAIAAGLVALLYEKKGLRTAKDIKSAMSKNVEKDSAKGYGLLRYDLF